jgi:uncharacterized protein (DUF1684 family)
MFDDGVSRLDTYGSLWDWRRRVAALYGAVRAQADPTAAWRLWRETRDRLFADHKQTPLDLPRRALFSGIPYFPYDARFRFAVALEPLVAGVPEPEQAQAGKDGLLELVPFATTRGLAAPLGRELTLYWIAGYGGGVFLPFRDETSGTETFAGGRYLIDSVKGADLGERDGRLILDFNFAYNPSCSYSERWVCPLAPPANRLPAAITAGEAISDAPSGRRRPRTLP